MLKIKFLKPFRAPSSVSKKSFEIGNELELETDAYGVVLNSFWRNQINEDESKEYFEVVKPNSPENNKSKK